MAAEYAWGWMNVIVIRASDGANIPLDENNLDYQRFLAWVADGGVPDPYPAPFPSPEWTWGPSLVEVMGGPNVG